MEKKNFITLVLGTVGGLLFAIGMCMCLLPEWNMFGIIVGVVGIVMLLFLIPMCVGLKDNEKDNQ